MHSLFLKKFVFTENGWTPWTGRTVFVSCARKKKFSVDLEIFCSTLILPRKGRGLRRDRRHLEGWWSWRHETCEGRTALCFVKIEPKHSQTVLPATVRPLLVPTIFSGTYKLNKGRRGADIGEGKEACSCGRQT